MATRLPINVVTFATEIGSDTKVYEQFQDYFYHYMSETQGRNLGVYDKGTSLIEKDKQMHSALLSEVERLSGQTLDVKNHAMQIQDSRVQWATLAVVSEMIDTVLPVTVNNSIGVYADIRNVGFGDSASFDIAPRTLFTVSQGANAQRESFVQKQFKTTKTLVAYNHVVTVEVALYRVLAGLESLAEFVRKAIISIETEMTKDAYDAFHTGITALTVPSALKASGYTADALLDIAQRVSAYNGGAKASIIGTTRALAKILPNGADAYRIVTPSDNISIQLIKNFYDYDIIVLPQIATGDYSDFGVALHDDEIYIVSTSSDKLVKGVLEGQTMTNINDYYEKANLTSNATINERWNFEFMSNAVAGVIELS